MAPGVMSSAGTHRGRSLRKTWGLSPLLIQRGRRWRPGSISHAGTHTGRTLEKTWGLRPPSIRRGRPWRPGFISSAGAHRGRSLEKTWGLSPLPSGAGADGARGPYHTQECKQVNLTRKPGGVAPFNPARAPMAPGVISSAGAHRGRSLRKTWGLSRSSTGAGDGVCLTPITRVRAVREESRDSGGTSVGIKSQEGGRRNAGKRGRHDPRLRRTRGSVRSEARPRGRRERPSEESGRRFDAPGALQRQ